MTSTEALSSGAPDHVPPRLFWDRSLEAFARELDDPFLAAARLHQGPDIFWARDAAYGRAAWVITRQALIQEAFASPEHFSSFRGSGLSAMLGVNWGLVPLDCDPPEHTHYRTVLNPHFTPQAMGELDRAIHETCRSLATKFEDRGGCEAISEFVTPFPTHIFLALMGMPTDQAPQFLAWEQSLLRGGDAAERIGAGKAIAGYLMGFIGEQRGAPGSRLLKGLVSTRIEERPLEDEEILGMLYLFYIAGLDTLQGAMGWILKHLACDQPLQARLRAHPEDIPPAVEELLRAYSVASTWRCVARDLVFHGVQMRQGDPVLLPLYLAARDPQAHENPHAIDLDRTSGRLAFGAGPHHCLGTHLVRREMRIVLEAFLSRFDGIHMPPGEACDYHTGVVFGVDRLPLAWEGVR